MSTTRHLRGRGLGPCAAAFLALLQPLLGAAAPGMPPRHITNNASLTYGRFVPAGGGTITVSPAGVRTRTGGVVLLMSTAGAARFTIGEKNPGNEHRAYIVTLPPNGTVALVSGANRMPVNHFVSSGPAGGTLPARTHTLSVGATLQVAPNQPRGVYSGTFPVTLEYQ